jgi:histidyl-tRNA synthetase
MSLPTQPYKGARDFYPEDKRLQKYMFGVLRQVVESFGYQEYDAPLLEPLEIYLAKSGEEIVNQQLYSFEDKGERKVAIRPEMTPSVSRMVAAKRQELSYPLRWYSIPNLWRYERPQAGRLREHWQLNVDIFGLAGLAADHEIILVTDNILQAFGAAPDDYVIRVNSRQLVDQFLKDYMKLNDAQVYETSKLIDRWHKVERTEFHSQAKEILTNDKQYRELIELMESKDLDSLPPDVRNHQSAQELKELMSMLASSGVKTATFDFSVIRGMDYYNGIVFEVFDTNPENIRSMFGGGRYDGLVSLFGAEPLPTVGFGMGDVTLQRFLDSHKLLPKLKPETDVVAMLIGDVYGPAQKIIHELRAQGVNVAVDSSGRKLDAQIKSAVKSGVRHALFIGQSEIESNQFKLRDLEKGEEKEFSLDQVASSLKAWHQNS